MNRNKNIAYCSIYLAISILMNYLNSYIPFLKMSNGGSIDISLIPLILCGIHLGFKSSMITTFSYWLITSLLGFNSYYLNIIQYIFDYIIPIHSLSLIPLFVKDKKNQNIIIGITIVFLIRYFSFLISGIFFFIPDGSYAGSFLSILNSFAYNTPYNIVSYFVSVVVVLVILKRFKKWL